MERHMGRSTRARRKGAQGEAQPMEGQDKRRRTLTFVAVGAEVVGVRVLEGQQDAREGKREEFDVAAHSFVVLVLLGKSWRVGDAILCSVFWFLDAVEGGGSVGGWSGECGPHDAFHIEFCGHTQEGETSVS